MGLFLHETTSISAPLRPRVSVLAVWALILASTGFINVVGFVVGPALAVVALMRFRLARDAGIELRGHGLAVAALWMSGIAVVIGVGALLVLLIVAYAQLPSRPVNPHFHLF